MIGSEPPVNEPYLYGLGERNTELTLVKHLNSAGIPVNEPYLHGLGARNMEPSGLGTWKAAGT